MEKPDSGNVQLLMRVLLIDNSLDNTGASKALIKSIKALPSDEFKFIFLFPQKSNCVAAAKEEGFLAFRVDFIEISKRIKDLLLYLPRLFMNAQRIKALVKKEQINIIHVNDIYNLTGLVAKLLCGVKVVTHIRRMPESFPSSIYKLWSMLHVRFADHIIAVSEANMKALPANSKTSVVYDPLPEEEQLELYVPKQCLNKQVTVLCLANFTNGKGHMYVLKLAKLFHEEYPDWKVQINFYGGVFGLKSNMEYKNSLKQASIDMQIDDLVSFYDQTNKIEEIMKKHDISLNLSDSESFSRVTLESLFFGVPTIATNVGGTNEMIVDRQTGILVDRCDVNSMYEGFKSMVLDDNLRQSISRNSYRYVREKFGESQTVEKLANIYRSIQ